MKTIHFVQILIFTRPIRSTHFKQDADAILRVISCDTDTSITLQLHNSATPTSITLNIIHLSQTSSDPFTVYSPKTRWTTNPPTPPMTENPAKTKARWQSGAEDTS
jgi:hypothetical protein